MLEALYGRATALRRAWYRHPHRLRRLDRPVISVGNLAVGGSGKSPLVATLARMLLESGERPAILSRGYGRREPADGVVVVGDGSRVVASPEQAGDEPYMLARALPGAAVLVCADRHLSGRLAERRFACTVHLLDDGFQHLRLERDVDLLVMSGEDLDDRLLPFGRLREPLAAARAATAILVNGGDADVQAIRDRLGVETTFRVMPRYGAPRLVQPPAAEAGISGRRVVAVAGIARPHRFFGALRDLGFDVAREIVFRDHRWFTAADVEAVRRAAAETAADLVMTTEKDAVRLHAHGNLGAPWAFLPLDLLIDPGDRFGPWLAGHLAAARRRRLGDAA